ncbi:MAG TPA: hypothetical protein VN736_21080 [Candidatus Limnocylindrales bacterium]|nr:hypothetical protein [Candidatus Limnocylindrales bacterium]
MSLQEFQRALCDMTLNPVFAAAVLRKGAPALSGYRLSGVEAGRLLAVVSQRGMSVNCTLARANRFAPIADAFPLTCSLLKPHLRGLLDELWSVHRPGNYQLTGEAGAFAQFLDAKLSSGELDVEYAAEVFRYESKAWDLIQTLRSSVCGHSAIVHFTHDPSVLIKCLERDELPPAGLPAGAFAVRLTLNGDTLEVDLVVAGLQAGTRRA